MTRNAIREALSIGVLCLAVFAPAAAEAVCGWAPPGEELFTVPANGATNVPTDARLWVLVGMGATGTVVMDGAELEETKEGSAWRSYKLPDVEAGQTYGYTVSICSAAGCPESFDYGPYSFTVGESPAEPPVAPELLEMTALPTEGNVDEHFEEGTCDQQIMLQDCYDVGPLLHYKLVLKENPNASHFAVWAGEKKTGYLFFSTADCPVQYIGGCQPPGESDECDPSTDGRCLKVAAYNEAGGMSEPAEFCMPKSSSGCGISSRSGVTATLLPTAVLILLLLLWGIRRRYGK